MELTGLVWGSSRYQASYRIHNNCCVVIREVGSWSLHFWFPLFFTLSLFSFFCGLVATILQRATCSGLGIQRF